MQKIFSVPRIALAILWEIGKGTTQAFFPHRYAKKYGYSAKHFSVPLKRLKKRGLIRWQGANIYLTPDGRKEAFWAFAGVESYFNQQPAKWDGQWRIMFFDIPEKKRSYRDHLRAILKIIGFKEFQRSVWIYPHKVPHFLKNMLFDENIKHYTRLITTTGIEYDKDMQKLFKLNSISE